MNRALLWLRITINTYQGKLEPKSIEKLCPLTAIISDTRYWENSQFLMNAIPHSILVDEEHAAVAKAKYQWCLDNLDANSYAFIHYLGFVGTLTIEPEQHSRLIGVVFQDSRDATAFKLSFDEA